jgi:hypothetical protein
MQKYVFKKDIWRQYLKSDLVEILHRCSLGQVVMKQAD